jgi:predicted Zn-dependent peptidase
MLNEGKINHDKTYLTMLLTKSIFWVPRENRTLDSSSTNSGFTTKLWAPYAASEYAECASQLYQKYAHLVQLVRHEAALRLALKRSYVYDIEMTHTKARHAEPVQSGDTDSPSELRAMIERELRFEPFAFDTFEVETVPVTAKHFSFAPCIHLHIGFRYGAIHDEPGKEGTAHFLEHMIFDGSSMFKDEKETQEFGKTVMLDTLNAYTGMFELFVTGKCLPHNFDKTLEGIFSMIISPKLTEKSWDHERKVITQEAWGKFLNEKRIAYLRKERENTMYDIPDRLRTASALGWPDTVLQITHADIVDAHRKYFVRENMEIYIAGNIDAVGGLEKLKHKLHEFLVKIPSGERAKDPFIPKNIGNPKNPRFDHTYDEVGLSPRQQTSISLSTTVPRINKAANRPNDPAEDAHLAALSIAGDLVADLIYRKLRLENSWCYGAGAGATITTDYLGFNMGGSIDFNHVDEAIGIIWDIVDDVKKGNADVRADFEKTKRLAIDNLMAKERTTGAILDSIIDSIKVNGEIESLRKWLLQIADITYEDVQTIVATYADKEKMFTEIVRPERV